MNYKGKSVCIIDNGLFSELARTLSKSFGQVWYTSPWVSGFPKSGQLEIAEGMAGIERVDDFLEVVDECDLFVFPDVYQGPAQTYLSSIGKRVWGSRAGDELEIHRADAKDYFSKLGIPQAKYDAIVGMEAVRKHVQKNDKEKLWIKGGKNRGDFETFNVEGYALGKARLDDIEARIGPKAREMTYIVEPNLKETIDIAIDTYSIDGQYPATAALGSEEKGELYIGAAQPWTDIPGNLRDIYERLSPTLKAYQYRNFLSLESRADGKEVYLGDPCCRGGSPPLELQLNWIKNLDEIIWEGASGHLVEPQYAGRYGVELIIHSDWADEHPLMVDFPKQLREQIKFRYNSEFDGKTWILPQGAGPRVAAVVACGDSMEDCVEECKEISGQLKGTQVEAFTRSFPIIKEKLETLAEWGYAF